MSDDTGGGPREHALNIVAARKRGMTIQRETVNHQWKWVELINKEIAGWDGGAGHQGQELVTGKLPSHEQYTLKFRHVPLLLANRLTPAEKYHPSDDTDVSCLPQHARD